MRGRRARRRLCETHVRFDSVAPRFNTRVLYILTSMLMTRTSLMPLKGQALLALRFFCSPAILASTLRTSCCLADGCRAGLRGAVLGGVQPCVSGMR